MCTEMKRILTHADLYGRVLARQPVLVPPPRVRDEEHIPGLAYRGCAAYLRESRVFGIVRVVQVCDGGPVEWVRRRVWVKTLVGNIG